MSGTESEAPNVLINADTTTNAAIKPDTFTFRAAESKNGGTVLGPFVNDGNLTVDKYMIIIYGNVNNENGNVSFKPESNSIILMNGSTPYASINTNGDWMAEPNTFVPKQTAVPDEIKNVLAANQMFGGRNKKNKSTRRNKQYYKKAY